MKFLEFAEIGNWKKPIVIFPSNSINFIKELCSFASNNNTRLDCLEDFNEISFNDLNQKIAILSNSALKGSWILISTSNFKFVWNKINEKLSELKLYNRIHVI